MQFADKVRVWVRTDGGTEYVVDAIGIRHPDTQRLVDRGAQGCVAGGHSDDFGAEPAHPVDVRSLALDVDSAHVDRAGQADSRAGSGGGHTVLTGTGFCDYPLRSEALREDRLPYGVVDLVRAGMRQVLALQPDVCTPALGQSRRMRQRRRPTDPLT